MNLKKFYTALMSILLAVCIVVPMAACGAENASASMVELDRSTLTLNVGEEATLTYTVFPENAASGGAKWTSTTPSVATVKDGKVTGISEGKAGIRVTVGGKSADCTVTVVDPSKAEVPATGITLNQRTLALEVGGSATLVADVTPENASNKTVTWSSSAETVATVGTNGVVSALADGTAVITAKTHNNFQATCVVTVGSGVVQSSGL